MGQIDDFLSKNNGSGGEIDNFLSSFDKPKQNTGIVGDTGTDLKRGIEQLPGAVTGLADIVNPLTYINDRRYFDEAADWAGKKTGFQPGQWQKDAEAEYSPERQASDQAVNKAWEEGGAGNIAKSIITNPRSIAGVVAQSLPSTIGGGVLARGAMKGIAALSKADMPVLLKAAQLEGAAGGPASTAINRMATAAGGIGEGAITAGQNMDQVSRDASPRLAAATSLAAGATTGLIGTYSGRLANAMGLPDIETAMAGGGLGKGGLQWYKRIPSSMAQEGLLQELPQSAQEQAWQNVAEGKPWHEGVARAAIEGAIAGVAMGGGVALIPHSGQSAGQEQAPPQEQPQLPPTNPLNGIASPYQGAPIATPTAPVAETKLPETGPLSAAVNVGIASGATTLRPAQNHVADVRNMVQPTGTFGQMDEFANLLGSEKQDKDARIQKLLDTQALQQISDTESADARVEAQRIYETSQARRGILYDVLDNIESGRNPSRAFGDALKANGYADTTFSPEEKATIEAFKNLAPANVAPDVIPSATNELDAASVGIKEKAGKGSAGTQNPPGFKQQQEKAKRIAENRAKMDAIIAQRRAARPVQEFGNQPNRTEQLNQTLTNLPIQGIDNGAKATQAKQAETKGSEQQSAPAVAQNTPQSVQQSAPVRSYPKGQATALAARLTKNGLPSKAIPHPTETGLFAIVPSDYAEPNAEATNKKSLTVEPKPASEPALRTVEDFASDSQEKARSAIVSERNDMQKIADGKLTEHQKSLPKAQRMMADEAKARLSELDKMESDIPAQYGSDNPSVKAAYDMHSRRATDEKTLNQAPANRESSKPEQKKQESPAPVVKKASTEEAIGQQDVFAPKESPKSNDKQVEEGPAQSVNTDIGGSASIVAEMINSGLNAVANIRKDISDVKFGPIVDGVETITYSFRGKKYRAKMRGRNKDYVLYGNDSESDKSYATQALIDGDAEEISAGEESQNGQSTSPKEAHKASGEPAAQEAPAAKVDPVSGKMAEDKPAPSPKKPAAEQDSQTPNDGIAYNVSDSQNIWYSALSRFIDNAQVKSAPAIGWKQQIKGALAKGSIKPAEVEAVGINDWLDLQQGKVSKEQVQAFLEQNGVQVQDVVLGGGVPQWITDKLDAYDARIGAGEKLAPGEVAEYKALEKQDEAAYRESEKPKFASYQLPGGGNYRELLLTLPGKESTQYFIAYKGDSTMGTGFATRAEAEAELADTFPGRVDLEVRAGTGDRSTTTRTPDNFRSSHFDQPNILAHVRFNDRIDADGKRVLFLEEFQSDWAQKGRKEGFAEEVPIAVRKSVDPEADEDTYEIMRGQTVIGYTHSPTEQLALENAKSRFAGSALSKGVPSAPFVTKTEAWTALALKRMIRYAAENGFDKVAWTTGEQQAGRYDLSKQVDRVEYWPDQKILTAWKDGIIVIQKALVDKSDLPEIIGKELAQKIINAPEINGGHQLRGDDIRIGGEGMKSFYDKIIPNVANDVLKKLGGGKVETVILPAKERGNGNGWGNTNEDVTGIKESAQLGFTITQKMRETVMAGQPLFSNQSQKNLSPADKAIYGMVSEGKTAAEVLKFIGASSRNPFYRHLARLLMKTGISPTLTLGEEKGWTFNAGEGKYAAAYNPKTDTVALFRPASSERNVLHELMHAATMKALEKKGLPSVQMQKLYEHVTSIMGTEVHYGLKNLDEFIAEAFTNPKFQAELKKISAPKFTTGLASAWDYFVRIVKGILRLNNNENALSAALEIGVGVMRENMKAATLDSGIRYAESKLFHDARSFVDSVMKNGDGFKFFDFATVGAGEAAKLKAKTGLALEGYKHSIDDDSVRHAIRQHGDMEAEIARNQIGINADDLAMIPNIVESYDSVERGETQKDGRNTLVYKKTYGNGVTYYVEEVRTGRKKLVAKTMWKIGPAVPRTTSEDGVVHTSETSGGQPDSTISDKHNGSAIDQELSAGNPDIRYNIIDDAKQRVPPAIQNIVANAFTSHESTSWITPFNTQFHKAQKWAAEGKVLFKKVFDLSQQFIGDTSRYGVMAQNAAPTLFHEIRSPGDVVKMLKNAKSIGDITGASHTKDIESIAMPLYDGTLYGGANPLSGVIFSDGRLRSQYKLNDRQIKLYHEALASVRVSMDEMAKSIIAKHAKNNDIAFDREMGVKEIASEVAQSLEEKKDQILETVGKSIEDAIISAASDLNEKGDTKGAKKLRDDFAREKQTAESTIARIDKTIEDVNGIASKNTALQDAGYFPLMRFGENTVTAKDANGEVQFFGMYEGNIIPKSGRYEANKVASEIRAMHPDWTVKVDIQNTEKYKLYAGMNMEAVKLFAEHMDADSLEPFQEYLRQATNNHSVMKRLVHRKGTPGFDKDVRRTLSQFIVSNARATASNYHLFDMRQAAEEADKDGGDIGKEAVKLYRYIAEPGEEAHSLRGFMFFNYLGGSIASAMVNLTQVPLMTFPFLAKYSGATNLASLLARSARMAVGNQATMSGNLGEALRQAELDGVTAPQEIHQLRATAMNTLFSGSRAANLLLKTWGAPFAMAESFNRRTTFIAAYQIAEKMSAAELKATGSKSAFEFAENAVNETQGIYNKGNRMNVGRGAVGATLMTFKQFSIMYLELLKRLPKKQRMMMIGLLLLSAGGGGLPFADDLEDIIDTIGQWLGYATNSRKTVRNVAESLLGKTGADITINGAASQMGIDLHSRFGMQNLLPGTGILKQSSINKGRDIEEFFGPAAGIVKSVGDALEALATGHPGRAALAVAPNAASNLYKGATMLSTGYGEDSKGRRTVKTNIGEGVAKSIGFNPKALADYSTIKGDIYQDSNLMQVKREQFTSAMVDAILHGDAEARKQATLDMMQWNRDNPALRVIVNPSTVMQRVRAARTEGIDRFIKAMPKTMKQSARSEFLN